MAEKKTGELLQLHMRQNVAELNDFLKDLNSWETDIKEKDEDLKFSKLRISSEKSTQKEEKKVKQPIKDDKKKRINSYDYRSWDKLDVDKVLEEMDEAEELKTRSSSGEESEDELSEDEDIEEERRLQQALIDKEKGNTFFKDGQYELAIESYTRGIEHDPSNAILPANRAMALIKLGRLGAAEQDCNFALSLDPTYLKALRRGAARIGLGKLEEAQKDYENVLKHQPGNREAMEQISQIKKLLGIEDKTDKIKDPPPKPKRNKKPMRRIPIQEIGSDSEDEKTSHTSLSSQTGTTPPLASEIKSTSAHIIEDIISTEETLFHSEGATSSQQATVDNRFDNIAADIPSTNKVNIIPQTIIKQTFATPKTAIQFQTDWKKLPNSPEMRYEYVKKIPPENYPKLLSQSIESDVLVELLKIYRDYYIPAMCPVFKEMKYLSEIKRFNMTVMFFSAGDKTVAKDLIEYLRNQENQEGFNGDDIEHLAKKYGVG